MCGRFLLSSPPDAVAHAFDVDVRDNFPARYNIAPTQPVAVIHMNERRARVYGLMRWGFIPSWSKRPETRPLINARGETVAEKPTFRAAFKRRRCLVPADGFYEWTGPKGDRDPWCVKPAAGGVVGFAGVWETATDPDGGEIDTVAILTCAAGPDMKDLHHREPVVVAPANYSLWLEADERDRETAQLLIGAADEGFWRAYRVDRAVNNARNQGEGLDAAVEA